MVASVAQRRHPSNASVMGRPTLLWWATAMLVLPALTSGMIFTPSPDKAGHMRSNWDNWYA